MKIKKENNLIKMPFPNKEKLKEITGTQYPLVVDLDGTLLLTDLLYESIALLLRHKPWLLLLLPLWLFRGKAYLKRRLTQEVELDLGTLPFNEKLIDWLKSEKSKGRELALVSASDAVLVSKVAERFPFFEFIKGSDGVVNLSGPHKLSLLLEKFGNNFTYAGNSSHDFVIWNHCQSAVLVGHVSRLRKRLASHVITETNFPVQTLSFHTWIRALRLHQWVKNILIFIPLFLSGSFYQIDKISSVTIGFFCLSLLASGTYLINDLLDLATDRQHRSKRHRPLASGELSILYAFLALPVIFGLTTSLFFFMPLKFIFVCAGYLALTLSYSFSLKKKPILDLIILAILFSLRILAGMVILEVPISPWLLAFSMFFFFSLGAIKRYSECLVMHASPHLKLSGRGYQALDSSLLLAFGAASSFSSSIVFFIYLMDTQSSLNYQYAHPKLLWLICIILNYWLGRVWYIAFHGQMHDDPIIFALKDRTSLVLGTFAVFLIILAHGIFI